ncbi:MAG: hypothetical protein K2O89_05730 [Clostridia bacterium]|nr:hypothetical protein [Clostridia bacterium]
MKSKQLIRFYFSAGSINKALDNLILDKALKSANFGKSCEYYAERIFALIDAKRELSVLWNYLDGVVSTLTERERAVLKFYGGLRVGLSKLTKARAKEVKRVAVKFTRHARNVGRYGVGVRLVKEYYCLIN